MLVVAETYKTSMTLYEGQRRGVFRNKTRDELSEAQACYQESRGQRNSCRYLLLTATIARYLIMLAA